MLLHGNAKDWQSLKHLLPNMCCIYALVIWANIQNVHILSLYYIAIYIILILSIAYFWYDICTLNYLSSPHTAVNISNSVMQGWFSMLQWRWGYPSQLVETKEPPWEVVSLTTSIMFHDFSIQTSWETFGDSGRDTSGIPSNCSGFQSTSRLDSAIWKIRLYFIWCGMRTKSTTKCILDPQVAKHWRSMKATIQTLDSLHPWGGQSNNTIAQDGSRKRARSQQRSFWSTVGFNSLQFIVTTLRRWRLNMPS